MDRASGWNARNGHFELVSRKLSYILFFTAVSVFVAVSTSAGNAEDSAIQPRISATELAYRVVQNELTAQDRDTSLWKYREVHQQDGTTQTLEIVQTKDGEVHRLLAVNGKPLNIEQRRKEDQRIVNLLADPVQFRQRQKNIAHDADQERSLLKMLPQAFLYEYDGVQDGSIKLRFRPNPAFHPTSHESEVFHHMQGMMLIDRRQTRLAEIDGELMSEVKFWDGILGHLDKGGTFRVKQRNVGNGHWEMTLLDVQMNGKALFFKTIAVREKQMDSDFRQLPGGTTLKQAGEFLKVDTAS